MTPPAATSEAKLPDSGHVQIVSSTRYPGLPDYSHPQYKYEALVATPTTPSLLANTEPFSSRIGMATGQAAVSSANPAPIIADIDTGFALNHDALKARWAINSAEQATGGVDNDKNGYINDWRGWDFVDGTNNPLVGKTNTQGSGVGHGTMTASLAAILAPQATIMPLKALDDNGVGYTDEIAAAVRYAADNGAKVINLSLGSSSDDPYLHAQIQYAVNKGVLVVAASGNSGCNCLLYPAAYPEVLSVGASDQNDATASFSNYGPTLGVLAPGTANDVCSATYVYSNPTGAYTCMSSGTSFASPITSGLAALLLQQLPTLSVSDLTAAIESSADKVPSMNGAVTTLTAGYGRINVAKAVARVSLAKPYGQILNKQQASLSSPTLASGPSMNSTCTGPPSALCRVVLNGPAGQAIVLGQQVLDAYGGANFPWDASSLGLSPGQWTAAATLTYYNQVTTSYVGSLTISP